MAIPSRVLHILAGLPSGRLTKWFVIVAWLALGLLVGPLARQLPGVERNDASALGPGAAESTQVHDLLAKATKRQQLPAVAVYVRTGGLTAADRAKVARDRWALAGLVLGRQVEAPVEAGDGEAMLLNVPLDGTDAKAAYDATKRVRQEVAGDAPAGLEVKVTGPAAFVVDGADAFLDVDLKLLLMTVAVVAAVLVLIYRSPVLWLAPLLTVVLAAGIAQGVVYLLVENAGLALNGLSSGILTVLVFGASTDYALLLVSRYREELRRHPDRHAAMRAAMRRAAPPIVASAATVGLGLLCLLAAEMNSNRSLGPVGAIGILCALVAMTTLLPAVLVALGRWVFWPWVPGYAAAVRPPRGVWEWAGGQVARRPRVVWLATTALLVACSAGLAGARIGLSSEVTYTTARDSVVGQRLLAAHFPGGASAPADVVARALVEPAIAVAAAATPAWPGSCPPPERGISWRCQLSSPILPTARPPRARSGASVPLCTPCPVAERWSAATPRPNWTRRTPSGTTATW